MRASLVALALSFATSSSAQTLEHLGTFEWRTPSVSGLSGLEVAGDGMTFVAISDQGWWLEGRFVRENGLIDGVDVERLLPVLGIDGLPVASRPIADWSDSEGLAIGDDGTIWISSERYARAWRYETAESAATGTRDHETFADLSDNRQLEAMAVDAEGRAYTIPERPGEDGFAIYRQADSTWVIDGYLPERDGFSIVGADFDETGALWILERKLVLLLWWQNRVRRVRLDGSEDRTIWTGARGQFTNLEGIAIWRDADDLRLTLVSDDNANRREPTQFVEFRLTD